MWESFHIRCNDRFECGYIFRGHLEADTSSEVTWKLLEQFPVFVYVKVGSGSCSVEAHGKFHRIFYVEMDSGSGPSVGAEPTWQAYQPQS